MVIKKFVGKTQEEACEAAKKELGDGIVIMNVKNVKPKGFLSFLAAKQVEVTAAVEDQPDSLRQIKREIKTAAQTLSSVQGQTAAKSNEAAQGAAQNIRGQGNHSLTGIMNRADADNIERKLDSLQILLENQFNKEEIKNKTAEGEKKAESARTEEQTATEKDKENGKKDDEQEKFLKLLYDTMTDNEVDEKYAAEIIEEARKNSKPGLPFDYILANIYQKLILKFGKAEGIVAAKKGPMAVFFIGPTGVGKTTSIAKVASSLIVEQKKKVALLTTDTYRIAAAEQLHTYANILEVPFRVVYTEEELKDSINAYKDYDYIFIDTAGHSHQNSNQMSGLKDFIKAASEVAEYQAFLVLSATTKYKDLLKIAERYKEVTNYQLIFTKLDETSGLGNLINVKLYMNIPIAYVADGQNVPSDIEAFNVQKTVKQILGGKN